MELHFASSVFQNMMTVFPEPVFFMLGSDAAAGIAFADAVALHQPQNPDFFRCGDGYRHIAKLCKAAFEECNGIDGVVEGIVQLLHLAVTRRVELDLIILFGKLLGGAVLKRR